MSHRKDPELIKACLAGEQRAWDVLVDRYSQLVYSVPRRLGLNEADAGEVAQNVFMAVFRKLGTLSDHELLARWLLTTAHRESWRVGKARSKHADLDAAVLNVSSPEDDQLERWERQHIVRLALEKLGGQCQRLLTALFLAGGQPNYEAIAADLEMKVGSIGPTRARCFAKLEPILEDLGLDTETFRSGSEGVGWGDHDEK